MELHAERKIIDVTDYEHSPADGLKCFQAGEARYTIDGKAVTEAEFAKAFLGTALRGRKEDETEAD